VSAIAQARGFASPLAGRHAQLRAIGSSLAAIVLALVLGGVLMAIAGGDPIAGYRAMIDGVFGTPYSIGQWLILAAPLTIIGLGLALAFRGRVYNIGAEGQFLMGALAAGAVAIVLPVAPWLLVLVAIACGIGAGVAWGGVVGVLRARWGVNEVITSLLLTYVASLFFSWSIRDPFHAPGVSGLQGKAVPKDTIFPTFTSLYVHPGVFAAAALVPMVGYLMARTPFGFRVRMLGLNPDAAEVAGVPRGRMVVRLMAISGGLAGLAGAIQIFGVADRLDPSISAGYGFTAIVVALLGRLRALGVLLAALFLAFLQSGGQAMSVNENLPYAIVLAMQGTFVVLLLVADRFARR
jgi:general nucleoside transport system permease protein